MEEYNTKEKDVLKILVEVATAKREAEIVSNTSTAINVIFILGILWFWGEGWGDFLALEGMCLIWLNLTISYHSIWFFENISEAWWAWLWSSERDQQEEETVHGRKGMPLFDLISVAGKWSMKHVFEWYRTLCKYILPSLKYEQKLLKKWGGRVQRI